MFVVILFILQVSYKTESSKFVCSLWTELQSTFRARFLISVWGIAHPSVHTSFAFCAFLFLNHLLWEPAGVPFLSQSSCKNWRCLSHLIFLRVQKRRLSTICIAHQHRVVLVDHPGPIAYLCSEGCDCFPASK